MRLQVIRGGKKMKRLIVLGLVVSLVMGIANTAFAQGEEGARMRYLAERKEPSTALLWSLFIPGGGQIYNEETAKGLLMLAGVIACIATMFEEETTRTEHWWGYVEITETVIQAPQVIGALAISIWSMIDAHQGVNRFNERLREKHGLSLLLDEEKTTLAYKFSF